MTFVQTDASVEEQCKALVEKAIAKYGRIDVLCNVAGINGKRCSFIENDNQDTLNTIKVNFMSQVYMANCTAQYMIQRKSGIIINTCSLCGFIANTEAVGYHASKGAVRIATQVMARDLAPHGIRVVAVAPGWVRTGLLLADIEEHGVIVHTNAKVVAVEPTAVVYEKDGKQHRIEDVDTIVTAIGAVPDRSIADALAGSPYEVKVIGDASSAKNGFKNIQEGYEAGLYI